MSIEKNEKQVVSKKRVIDHGEAYTAQREVNAMLDLVKQETERIESRFLEPACGIGNFLINKSAIRKNKDWVGKYKVYVPKAWGVGNVNKDWLQPFIGGPISCCAETYLVFGPFETKLTAENVISYTQTKFFHFLVGLAKITQESRRKIYFFVPMQDFSQSWTDEKLYNKYGLTKDEIAFIESIVRPMEANDG